MPNKRQLLSDGDVVQILEQRHVEGKSLGELIAAYSGLVSRGTIYNVCSGRSRRAVYDAFMTEQGFERSVENKAPEPSSGRRERWDGFAAVALSALLRNGGAGPVGGRPMMAAKVADIADVMLTEAEKRDL